MSRFERTMTFVGIVEDSFYSNYITIQAYDYAPEDVEHFNTRKRRFKELAEKLQPGDTFVIGLEDMWDTEPEEMSIPKFEVENLETRITELEKLVEELKNRE